MKSEGWLLARLYGGREFVMANEKKDRATVFDVKGNLQTTYAAVAVRERALEPSNSCAWLLQQLDEVIVRAWDTTFPCGPWTSFFCFGPRQGLPSALDSGDAGEEEAAGLNHADRKGG